MCKTVFGVEKLRTGELSLSIPYPAYAFVQGLPAIRSFINRIALACL